MKELGIANVGSRDRSNGVRKDDYGNFFGPSRRVISARVFQESEAARISKSNRPNTKSSVSNRVAMKSQSRDIHPPRATNGLKRKAECLKNTRDYSFLLSDDYEVPTSSKSLPPPRNVSAPKSDARPAQQLPRINNSKHAVNDRDRVRESTSNGNHHNRGRESASNGHHLDVRKRMPPSSQNKHKVGQQSVGPSRSKSTMEPRKQPGINQGSGPGRPIGPKRGMPSRTSVSASTVGKGYPESSNKPRMVAKQPMPSSRDQIKRPPQKPARHSLSDERARPKPKRHPRDEASDDDNPISMIRNMFRYNPDKFRDDDDVSDMEANYEDIMREERRSAKIARKEDEEQLRLIEEEERRAKMLQAKKRKAGH